MTDQATSLREIATAERAVASGILPKSTGDHRALTIAVTGGKGGVGKSNIAVNLAIELAGLPWKVSLLDADLALANADLLCGVNPQYHLGHVLSGKQSLEDIVVEVSNGVRLIPGGSGIEELANLSMAQQQRFIAELSAMEYESDFLIIDTPAGIGRNVTSILQSAAQVIVVTTPDPTAIVDAYATIKLVHGQSPAKPISIVVNNTVGVGDSEQTFAQLQTAALRFLQHPLDHLGTVPKDPELAEAVRLQIPVVDYAPGAPASRSLRLIAKRLDRSRSSPKPDVEIRPFWSSFIRPEPD